MTNVKFSYGQEKNSQEIELNKNPAGILEPDILQEIPEDDDIHSRTWREKLPPKFLKFEQNYNFSGNNKKYLGKTRIFWAAI